MQLLRPGLRHADHRRGEAGPEPVHRGVLPRAVRPRRRIRLARRARPGQLLHRSTICGATSTLLPNASHLFHIPPPQLEALTTNCVPVHVNDNVAGVFEELVAPDTYAVRSTAPAQPNTNATGRLILCRFRIIFGVRALRRRRCWWRSSGSRTSRRFWRRRRRGSGRCTRACSARATCADVPPLTHRRCPAAWARAKQQHLRPLRRGVRARRARAHLTQAFAPHAPGGEFGAYRHQWGNATDAEVADTFGSFATMLVRPVAARGDVFGAPAASLAVLSAEWRGCACRLVHRSCSGAASSGGKRRASESAAGSSRRRQPRAEGLAGRRRLGAAGRRAGRAGGLFPGDRGQKGGSRLGATRWPQDPIHARCRQQRDLRRKGRACRGAGGTRAPGVD